MRQRGTVETLCDMGAVVSVRRESACSGDCHKCAGCGAVTQTLRIRAENPIGARPGDKVYIESSTAVVLWASVLVYLAPVLGFFAGYFAGSFLGAVGLMGAAGFLLGWIPAILYNRSLQKKPPIYTIAAFVEQ